MQASAHAIHVVAAPYQWWGNDCLGGQMHAVFAAAEAAADWLLARQCCSISATGQPRQSCSLTSIRASAHAIHATEYAIQVVAAAYTDTD